MATVTLRQIKGSPLTNAELDANLTNINAETVDNSTAYRLRPSLDVDLVGSKTVSPLLSFSRGSTGTYYDGKTAVKAEENLFARSQEFDNSAWTKVGITVTADAISAPDGATTADKIVATNTANNTRALYYSFTPIQNVQYVISFFAKASEYSKFLIYEVGNGRFAATFDLVSQTTSTLGGGDFVSSAIVPLSSGWHRCVITVTGRTFGWAIAAAGYPDGAALSPAGCSYAGDGTSGVYIWGAQLEQRSSVTAYTPTTSAPITNYIPQLLTAPTNTPRFDHDPVTGELKGLMVEESRTNLNSQSQDLTQNLWYREQITSCANVIVAPDGTFTGNALIESTAASTYKRLIGYTLPSIVQQNQPFTTSVFVKPAGRNYVLFGFYERTNVFGLAKFDLTTGTYTGNVTAPNASFRDASITHVGNGWFRLATTWSHNVSPNAGLFLYFGNSDLTANYPINSGSYTGDGYSGIYIWGAQLEVGSQATSYIPTLLTYTSRNSTATYKGDDGYLKTAAINEARYERNALGGRQLLVESAGSNSLTRTERFDFWNKDNCYVTPNITLAPDGTWTADKLSEDSQNTFHRIGQGSVTNGTTYTFSIYAKPAGRTKFIYGTDGAHFGLFTLEGNGTASIFQNAISVSIKAVSGGWYYCVVTLNSGTAPTLWLLNDAGGYIYQGDGSKGIYIWGAQIETGSVATSYMPSTETFTSRASTATYYNSSGVLTTAAIDTARTGYAYDASRNQWISQGLIIEPAATNLLTYSDQFNNGAWSTQEASISPNAIIAPDGVQSADKLIAAATTQLHSVWRYTPGNLTNAICSVFAKKGEARYVALQPCVNVGATNAAIFDLETGQLTQKGSANSAGIIPIGNGWYRCWATTTNETLYNRFDIYVANAPTGSHFYQGDGTSGIYIWGAQLETGSVATSYIPTTSAQVTRAADVYTSTAGSRAADVYSSSVVTRSADQLSISKTSNWFNSVNGTLALAHDAASGQPLLGDGSTTILSSLGAGTINIDYSNSQLSVVTQSGQTTATQGIFNFDSDLQILGNSTTKANARIKYMKFYPNNVIGSTPEGSGFILDDGYAMLQEDGSVLFQE